MGLKSLNFVLHMYAAKNLEVYVEPSQTMEPFRKIVNNFQPLTIPEKCFILDTWQGSKYLSNFKTAVVLIFDMHSKTYILR